MNGLCRLEMILWGRMGVQRRKEMSKKKDELESRQTILNTKTRLTLLEKNENGFILFRVFKSKDITMQELCL